MVRIHLDPPTVHCRLSGDGFWGISSAGRAPALQAGGRRFDPVILHQHFAVCVCVVWLLSQGDLADFKIFSQECLVYRMLLTERVSQDI